MADLKVTIGTVSNEFPGGTVGGNWVIEGKSDLLGGWEQTYSGAQPHTVFEGLEPGKYSFKAYRMDVEKNVLGEPVYGSYEVTEVPTAQIDTAAGLSFERLS